jgi:signal transduction histidine kinase
MPRALQTDDVDQRRRARVLAAFAVVIVISTCGLTAGALSMRLWSNAAALGFGPIVAAGILWRLRRGARIEPLGAIAGLMVFCVATSGAYVLGGLGSPPLGWYGVMPLLVLLIAGPRLGKAFVLLCVAGHSGFFVAQRFFGFGPAASVDPLVRYVDAVIMTGFIFAIALVYETFKQRAISEMRAAQERIEVLQSQLVDRAHDAGMAEVAASVLHNVGNSLNHVTISAGLVSEQLGRMRFDGLDRLSAKLAAAAQTDTDRMIVSYLTELATTLKRQREQSMVELATMNRSVEHVAAVIDNQQQYAGEGPHVALIDLKRTLEDAMRCERVACADERVTITAHLEEVGTLLTSKHRILLIFFNLFRNALHAVETSDETARIAVRLRRAGEMILLEVEDTGIGIGPEHTAQIFRPSFTTKSSGHGFGLHSSAIAAVELGGRLRFHSDGLGRGATFVLEIPCSPDAPRPAMDDGADG